MPCSRRLQVLYSAHSTHLISSILYADSSASGRRRIIYHPPPIIPSYGSIQEDPTYTSSVDGFLPASASNERLNLIGRNQYQLQTVKCYRIFSLWLLLAVLVPVFGMYLISDFLCTDTLICMRITVSIGLVFALIALFISAWYERKYRRCKSLLRAIRPGLEI